MKIRDFHKYEEEENLEPIIRVTLEELGTPFAEQYLGSGRLTGLLATEEDWDRAPSNYTYVGDLTLEEFYDDVDYQIWFHFGE